MHGVGRNRRIVRLQRRRAASFTFLQISDSHIGFNKPPNADARATFREAVAKVRALPQQPDFLIHTGDVSQLSRDDQFDDADQILKETGLPVFFIPFAASSGNSPNGNFQRMVPALRSIAFSVPHGGVMAG